MRCVVSLLIVCCLSLSVVAQDNTAGIKKYAETQVTNCTLKDGYVCEDISEDDFLSSQSQKKFVPAIYLPAWQAAYEVFQNIEDLTMQQKELKHYRIGMTESDDAYIVLFSALLLPQKIVDNTPHGITNITYGQTTKLWVDKESLQVTKYLFYR